MDTAKYMVFDDLMEGAQVISPEWKYVYVNQSLTSHGKYRREQLLGHTMMERYPGIEKTDMFTHLRDCMQNKVPHRLLNEFVFPDGSSAWFDLRMQAVPEGVLVLSFDITAQVRMEKQLEKNLEEQQQMMEQISRQKMQLEDFCQIIAHNLRAPLSNLSLLNEMVTTAASMEEKLQYLDKQKPVIDFLHEVLEELMEALQVKQDATVRSQSIDVQKEIGRVTELLSAEIIRSGAEVTTDVTELPTFRYPQKYFDSIVFNLLSNALKYRSPDRPPRIHLRTYRQAGALYLQVRDNGLGLDLKKHGDKLFRLRKTFHKHPDAKGFGLFITKTQVEAMGGNIRVESEPGQGSTFVVKLNPAS
ncbi:MAG: PAS domain-containing protein [Bacteroidia bacterium]|nr:PAS domain-containing protein [Bacteroidia bacterium]